MQPELPISSWKEWSYSAKAETRQLKLFFANKYNLEPPKGSREHTLTPKNLSERNKSIKVYQ